MDIDGRKQTRHTREETIFIEILSASREAATDNILLECTTQDISPDGLKIRAEHPFIVDSILELLISFESGGYKFLLTGQVKWNTINDEGDSIAGFEIIESEHSDYLVWRNMFAEIA
ncbi:MAG: PilZ domain-containing protein [Kangiellaceae bacterium]|nr:PilZ domain-containing protein [Kangiellaceae bacterium]